MGATVFGCVVVGLKSSIVSSRGTKRNGLGAIAALKDHDMKWQVVEVTQASGVLRKKEHTSRCLSYRSSRNFKVPTAFWDNHGQSQSAKPIHIDTSGPPLDGLDGMKRGLRLIPYKACSGKRTPQRLPRNTIGQKACLPCITRPKRGYNIRRPCPARSRVSPETL